MMVRVRAERIFPNCPRYIHRMQLLELSVYAPAPGHVSAGAGVEALPAVQRGAAARRPRARA